jgi:hypothetical protein
LSAVWVARLRETRAEMASGRPPARRHFGGVPKVTPVFGRAQRGYSRAELEAMTARARERAAADPAGLGRPLHFRECTGEFAAGAADGGHSVPTEVPAIRTFRLVKGGRDV